MTIPARNRFLLVNPRTGLTIDTCMSATLKDGFMDPLGSVEIEVSPLLNPAAGDPAFSDYLAGLQKGEEVQLSIAGATQGSFLIQEVKEKYSAKGSATLTLSCQSLLCTAHEANVDPDDSIRSASDKSVEGVVLAVLQPIMASLPGQALSVLADSQAHIDALSGKPLPGGTAPPFPVSAMKFKAAAAHEGETCAAFLHKIVTRCGVVMLTDGDGNIRLVQPDFTQPNTFQVGLPADPDSPLPDGFDVFYEEVEITSSNKGQYSEVNVTGQQAQVQVGDAGPVNNVSRPKASVKAIELDDFPSLSAYSSSVHPYKPLFKKDKFSGDAKKAMNAALLILGSRAQHAFVVKGRVDGMTSALTGGVWTVGTCGRVRVDARALDQSMFLLERTLHLTANDGEWTELVLIPKGALVVGEPPGS